MGRAGNGGFLIPVSVFMIFQLRGHLHLHGSIELFPVSVLTELACVFPENSVLLEIFHPEEHWIHGRWIHGLKRGARTQLLSLLFSLLSFCF